MVLKKDTCLFLLSGLGGGVRRRGRGHLYSPRGMGGGSECVFRLAHFIGGLGIATPEEEPRAPPVLSFFFFPLPHLDLLKKGVTPVGHRPSRWSALGNYPLGPARAPFIPRGDRRELVPEIFSVQWGKGPKILCYERS